MWSIGVIIFSLLCGYHPFDNDDEDELVNLILTCDYDFKPEKTWDNISRECKRFIEQLLEPNIAKRLTPEQAL